MQAGVPERVAMQITGHKTRSVFDRYHIVSDGDLREAARKIDRAAGIQTKELGYSAGYSDTKKPRRDRAKVS